MLHWYLNSPWGFRNLAHYCECDQRRYSMRCAGSRDGVVCLLTHINKSVQLRHSGVRETMFSFILTWRRRSHLFSSSYSETYWTCTTGTFKQISVAVWKLPARLTMSVTMKLMHWVRDPISLQIWKELQCYYAIALPLRPWERLFPWAVTVAISAAWMSCTVRFWNWL